MGRRKIEIEPITDERNRSITFAKRKTGLLKKARELATLCQVDIAVIIINESNKNFFEYSSRDMDSIIDDYKTYKGFGSEYLSKTADDTPHQNHNNVNGNHYRYISNGTSFSNNDSIGDDDDDSGVDEPTLKHKRTISEINKPTSQPTRFNKTMAIYSDQIPQQARFENINVPTKRSKSNSYSGNFPARLQPNNMPNGLLVRGGSSLQEFVPISNNVPPFNGRQLPQMSLNEPNPYNKLRFAGSKLSQFEDRESLGIRSNFQSAPLPPPSSMPLQIPPQSNQNMISDSTNNNNNNNNNNSNNNNNNKNNNKNNQSMLQNDFVFPAQKPPVLDAGNHMGDVNCNNNANNNGSTYSNPPTSTSMNSNEQSNGSANDEDFTKHRSSASNNSNIPYSAASSPAFGHNPKQSSNISRPVLRVTIPEDRSDVFKVKDEDSETNLPPLSKEKDSTGSSNKNINSSLSSKDGSSEKKSTPLSASLPSGLFQFGSNGKEKSDSKNPTSLNTNLPPTSGILSSTIRPFLFATGNGEQTPVSGFPMNSSKFIGDSKYMSEFFPSPSNFYGEWNVNSGDTPIRTGGITLPLPSLHAPKDGKSGDTSLNKHSLNNPNGSIKDELPSPIINSTIALPFGHFPKEKTKPKE